MGSVEKSLADAYVWKPDAMFRAAFYGEQPVGYVLIFPFDADEQRQVNIERLMIDAGFHGRGFGRLLVQRTLDWVDVS